MVNKMKQAGMRYAQCAVVAEKMGLHQGSKYMARIGPALYRYRAYKGSEFEGRNASTVRQHLGPTKVFIVKLFMLAKGERAYFSHCLKLSP